MNNGAGYHNVLFQHVMKEEEAVIMSWLVFCQACRDVHHVFKYMVKSKLL